MRRSIPGVFVVLLLATACLLPQKARAVVFLSEDWDTGTPPTDWPCKNFPNAYTTSTFNGWESKDYDLDTFGDAGSLSGLSATIFHSPPRSYYQHRPTNNYATCDIGKYLPQPYPTKINLRFYINFTDNWSHFNEALAGEVVHLIFLGRPISGAGWKLDIREYVSEQWPYECSRATQPPPNMYFFPSFAARGTNPYDCFNLIHHLNEWQCVEIMADAANDRYSLWINGDQKVNNVSTPVDTTIDRIVISGWNSLLRDYTGDFYIDDIVVADSYIGCGTSLDTLAPAAPQNLSVQ